MHVNIGEPRGLRDFQRELRRLLADLPDELADTNQQAARHVVDEAKHRARGLGPLWARAARSLSAARSRRIALVRLGGARHPEALGAEFGAGQDRPRVTSRGLVSGWNQFPPWRGSGGDAGYFLYPTIRAEIDTVEDFYRDALDRVTRRAFPD